MSSEFRCGCGFIAIDDEPLDHTPTPPNCCNCGGRKCMDCVLRYMHDNCEDSCPSCCKGWT